MSLSWKAKYYDGETAQSILAQVTVDGNQLIIRDQNQQQIDIWDIQTIQLDPNHLDYKYLLTTLEPNARIEMTDVEMRKHFESLKKFSLQKILDTKKIIVISGLTVLGCLAGLYFVTQPLSRYLAKKIPFEYELKLASQMKYNELFHVCRANKGPEKNEYQFIVKIKQLYPDTVEVLRDLKKIKVIKMDQSNAFALPGGYIFITDKFINEAKTYEEIVGVIAHEQGHFFNRHHLQAMIRGSLLTMSASFATGDVTSFMLMDPSTLMSIVSLKFNREDEVEADRFAAEQILKKMHLSTGGLIDFFDRSSKDLDVDVINHKVPDFLLTHPADVARIQMLKKYLTETPLNEIDPDDQINVLCD